MQMDDGDARLLLPVTGRINASPGAFAVAGPFALFAVENLADCRGGLRAVGLGVAVGYGRRSKKD
jgi:hypothetical protein